MEIPMWIFGFILCFYFTLARPSNKKPPCKEYGQKEIGIPAADQLLEKMGYKTVPKTLSDWKAAFIGAAKEYENVKSRQTLRNWEEDDKLKSENGSVWEKLEGLEQEFAKYRLNSGITI